MAQRVDRILRSDFIILDEVGCLTMDATGSSHLFRVIAKAHETRCLIVASNLGFQELEDMFNKPATAAAVPK